MLLHQCQLLHARTKELTVSKLRYRPMRERIGDLECTTVKCDQAPTAIVVLCHGFGAGGDDLVGLAPDLLHARTGTEPVELIFPAGIISLADEGFADGRAWWRLSIQRFLAAIESGQYEAIREQSPPGIDEARDALKSVIDAALSRSGLDSSRLLLGGFSQGAMLAMECACCGMQTPPGGLSLFSGCLIREQHWLEGVDKLKQTPVVQSHGSMDPILPLRTGLWLRDFLKDHECEVEFLQFQGPHTISGEAIESSAALLDEIAES